jgi:surface carbohydrate biosynthesis protein
MSAKDIEYVILVEHTARELDIACLIKYLIEQTGSTAEVMPLRYFNANTMKNNHVKVLAVPFCYFLGPTYMSIIPHFRDISIINLAYEQILSNINKNLKAPSDEFTKHFVFHHAWSKNYFDFLIKNGVDSSNVIINGNLSYSLYKYPYNKYFISRQDLATKYHLDLSKKWLFFPENYYAAFYSESIINEKVAMGMNLDDALQYRNFATQSLQKAIKWCAKSLNSHDIEIIFRPRPATSLEKMKDFIADVIQEIPEGFKVIKDRTVREWVLASDIVISSYSTSLIEAAIAEKPIAMLCPLAFPEYLNAEWYDMVPKIRTFNEFSEFIASPSPDSYRVLKKWAETELMSKEDPVVRIVNLMMTIKDGGIRIPALYLKRPKETAVKRLYKNLNYLSCLKNKFFTQQPIILEDYEDDFFTSADVALRVARWKMVLCEENQ